LFSVFFSPSVNYGLEELLANFSFIKIFSKNATNLVCGWGKFNRPLKIKKMPKK
jgi:hypothetical protein